MASFEPFDIIHSSVQKTSIVSSGVPAFLLGEPFSKWYRISALLPIESYVL
jgi:hypothetical protein